MFVVVLVVDVVVGGGDGRGCREGRNEFFDNFT